MHGHVRSAWLDVFAITCAIGRLSDVRKIRAIVNWAWCCYDVDEYYTNSMISDLNEHVHVAQLVLPVSRRYAPRVSRNMTNDAHVYDA